MLHFCFDCNKSFESKGALNVHKRFQCGAKTRCDRCGKLCSSVLSCYNHMKTCQPKKPKGALNVHKRFQCGAKTCCDRCGKLCSSVLSCYYHMKTCQPKKRKTIIVNEFEEFSKKIYWRTIHTCSVYSIGFDLISISYLYSL
ncbi:hypothetical protein MTR_0044s0120 [Medicago truncatula]|uniref:C2H2-type domain-containing protein n=1 Tax=Medicago truncatula TaxID=3880 RepID=G7ZUP9_MEDTR|nr:hypothetical protein MTR_0044s0120 [Medicago truncatula]